MLFRVRGHKQFPAKLVHWQGAVCAILTFDQQATDDLGVAVAVPHLAHVAAGVAGLAALDQQARHALPEAAVRLQGAVVLQPAVFRGGVACRLAGELHPMAGHDLPTLKAIQDHWLGVRGICLGEAEGKIS